MPNKIRFVMPGVPGLTFTNNIYINYRNQLSEFKGDSFYILLIQDRSPRIFESSKTLSKYIKYVFDGERDDYVPNTFRARGVPLGHFEDGDYVLMADIFDSPYMIIPTTRNEVEGWVYESA